MFVWAFRLSLAEILPGGNRLYKGKEAFSAEGSFPYVLHSVLPKEKLRFHYGNAVSFNVWDYCAALSSYRSVRVKSTSVNGISLVLCFHL